MSACDGICPFMPGTPGMSWSPVLALAPAAPGLTGALVDGLAWFNCWVGLYDVDAPTFAAPGEIADDSTKTRPPKADQTRPPGQMDPIIISAMNNPRIAT
jgi:hypothetical protein